MLRNHVRSGSKLARKRSKSCTQLDNPNNHCKTSHGLRNSITPQQIILARTEDLGARWNRDTEARHILLQQMQSLRQQALLTTPRNWTAESVRHTMSCMKGNRVSGVDCWTPREMLRLPKRAVAGLAKVMYVVEESLALPNQICVNIVALRSKPNGGGTEKTAKQSSFTPQAVGLPSPKE